MLSTLHSPQHNIHFKKRRYTRAALSAVCTIQTGSDLHDPDIYEDSGPGLANEKMFLPEPISGRHTRAHHTHPAVTLLVAVVPLEDGDMFFSSGGGALCLFFQRGEIICSLADLLTEKKDEILSANKRDMELATTSGTEETRGPLEKHVKEGHVIWVSVLCV